MSTFRSLAAGRIEHRQAFVVIPKKPTICVPNLIQLGVWRREVHETTSGKRGRQMFRTITTAVVGMVMVFGSMTTPEVGAQRRERSSARGTIRKRVDQELERRREAAGQENERRGSRLDELRERVNERTGQSETAPRGRVTNRIGNQPRRTFGQMFGQSERMVHRLVPLLR